MKEEERSRIRRATPEDAALITMHRHSMFRDNAVASGDVLETMDRAFEPWVRVRLIDERYVGLLLEENGVVLAGAGIFFCDFPPHWRHVEPVRAYVLNVYTEPAARGRGFAKDLMQRVLSECETRGVSTVTLHASPQGRPVYVGLGFKETEEMLLGIG